MHRSLLIILAVFSLSFAKTPIDFSKSDATDRAKHYTRSFRSFPGIFCSVSIGTYHGLYTRMFSSKSKAKSCVSVSKDFHTLSLTHFHSAKSVSGNAGSLTFGKKPPHQCKIALTLEHGKLTGTPYGDKALCESIRAEGKPLILFKKKVVPQPHILKILKYGAPHATGKTYPSKAECNKAKIHLSQENAGLDYTYICKKK